MWYKLIFCGRRLIILHVFENNFNGRRSSMAIVEENLVLLVKRCTGSGLRTVKRLQVLQHLQVGILHNI